MSAMLTVAEAATELGLSPRRVRELCQDGKLAYRRVTDRLFLIDPAALDAVRVRPPRGRPRKEKPGAKKNPKKIKKRP